MASSIRFFFVNRYDFFSSGNFKMKNRSADDVSLSEIGKFRLLLLFKLPGWLAGTSASSNAWMNSFICCFFVDELPIQKTKPKQELERRICLPKLLLRWKQSKSDGC